MTDQVGNQSGNAGDGFEALIGIGLRSTDRLGRVLFNRQEQMLPNGEVWEELSHEDKTFWISSATSVVEELQRILKEKAAGRSC